MKVHATREIMKWQIYCVTLKIFALIKAETGRKNTAEVGLVDSGPLVLSYQSSSDFKRNNSRNSQVDENTSRLINRGGEKKRPVDALFSIYFKQNEKR